MPDPVPPRLEDVRLQHLHHLPAGQLRAPRRGAERVQVREPPPPPRWPGDRVVVGAALELHEAVRPAARGGRRARVEELLDGVDAVDLVIGGGGGGGGGGEGGGTGARAEEAEEGRSLWGPAEPREGGEQRGYG